MTATEFLATELLWAQEAFSQDGNYAGDAAYVKIADHLDTENLNSDGATLVTIYEDAEQAKHRFSIRCFKCSDFSDNAVGVVANELSVAVYDHKNNRYLAPWKRPVVGFDVLVPYLNLCAKGGDHTLEDTAQQLENELAEVIEMLNSKFPQMMDAITVMEPESLSENTASELFESSPLEEKHFTVATIFSDASKERALFRIECFDDTQNYAYPGNCTVVNHLTKCVAGEKHAMSLEALGLSKDANYTIAEILKHLISNHLPVSNDESAKLKIRIRELQDSLSKTDPTDSSYGSLLNELSATRKKLTALDNQPEEMDLF